MISKQAHGTKQMLPGAWTMLTSRHIKIAIEQNTAASAKEHITTERGVAARLLHTELGCSTSAWMDERREHDARHLGVLRSPTHIFVVQSICLLFMATYV